jgi:hypothetical protein
MNQIRNVPCSLIRRLKRMESRLGIDRKRRVRLEFYDRSPDGTLIRRPNSDDDRTDAGYTIQVVFVKPKPEVAEPGTGVV